jgi:histidinol-phosphate aminotransferase
MGSDGTSGVEYRAGVSQQQIGQPRGVVDALPSYRPGKGAEQAEAEHGITNAIKLASNENPDHPLDPIVAAVAAAAAGANRYPDHRATELRAALARRLDVDVEQVTVGNGSSGLLNQIIVAYVDPGDEVLYPWRSFEAYPVFTSWMDGRSVTVPLTAALAFDGDALVAAVTDRTKLLFLATPNNPTGVATTTGDLAAIIERIPERVLVVVDEAYREFVDPGFGDPVDELLPRFPNVVVTRTFSKAHGLAGLRVGYAVGDRSAIATIDKTLLPFSVNSLAQAAAMAAIEHEPAITRRVEQIKSERSRVEAMLADAGWTLPDHQGNFVWLATGDTTDAVGLGLEQRGVVVRPFSGDGVRVTIGSPSENDRFVTTLDELAAAGIATPG